MCGGPMALARTCCGRCWQLRHILAPQEQAAQAAAFLGLNAGYGQSLIFRPVSELLKMILLLLFSFSFVVWEEQD